MRIINLVFPLKLDLPLIIKLQRRGSKIKKQDQMDFKRFVITQILYSGRERGFQAIECSQSQRLTGFHIL